MTLLKSLISSFKKIIKKSKKSLARTVFPKVKKIRKNRQKIKKIRSKRTPVKRKVKRERPTRARKILKSKSLLRIKVKRIPIPDSRKSAQLAQQRTPPVSSKNAQAKGSQIFIGPITHFFSRISVCVIKIANDQVRSGDSLLIKGAKTNFVQKVESLQIESVDVRVARKGHLAGLKVNRPARVGDKVFKIIKFQ